MVKSLDDKFKELKPQLEASFDDYVEELKHIVTIQSISVDPTKGAEMIESAENVKRLLVDAGVDEIKVVTAELADGKKGAPAVIAKKYARVNKDTAPTVLLYAHHDVQPARGPEYWHTSPFEPVIKNGRLVGRGSADDGAGVITIYGVLKLLGDDLPVNVNVFIEGEEESASPSMDYIMTAYKDDLDADVLFLADSGNWDYGIPAITQTLRGALRIDIKLEVIKQPVHSGEFSGPILDPLTQLCRIIATFHDENGDLQINGLKSEAKPEIDDSETTFKHEIGLLNGGKLAGTSSISHRLWGKPTFTLIGIDATDVAHASNTITNQVRAALSFRLAPSENPSDAVQAIKKHILANNEYGAKITFESADETGFGFTADLESDRAKAVIAGIRKAWGEDVVAAGMGGSIPFAKMYETAYPNALVLVTGVESPDSYAHGDNESADLNDLRKIILGHTLAVYNLGA
ncbi:MAG: M20/M25/M40 family metallo-hydrolase [Bifidobacteriaceae bacterium]|jgi:acetylornithine deacetylase/succinyl-diaminopimelate desuccinylase-like protein|nr:M20/M25/M40 family metallo-hydrolase [Bifidobacteriaceae bacterium]